MDYVVLQQNIYLVQCKTGLSKVKIIGKLLTNARLGAVQYSSRLDVVVQPSFPNLNISLGTIVLPQIYFLFPCSRKLFPHFKSKILFYFLKRLCLATRAFFELQLEYLVTFKDA